MRSRSPSSYQNQAIEPLDSLKDKQNREQPFFGLKRVDNYLMDIRQKSRSRLLSMKKSDKSVQGTTSTQIQDLTKQIEFLEKQNISLSNKLTELDFSYKELEQKLVQSKQQTQHAIDSSQDKSLKVEQLQEENRVITQKYHEVSQQMQKLHITNKQLQEDKEQFKKDPMEEQENRVINKQNGCVARDMDILNQNMVLEKDLQKTRLELQQQKELFHKMEEQRAQQQRSQSFEKQKTERSAKISDDAKKQLAQSLSLIQDFRLSREELIQDILEMEEAFFSNGLIHSVTSYISQQEKKLLWATQQQQTSKQQQAFQQKSKVVEKKLQKATDDLAEQQKANKQLQDDLEVNKEKLEYQLKTTSIELNSQISYYKIKYQEEFDKRKRLHNELLEIKGSIRVFVRIRPLLSYEVQNNKQSVFETLNEEMLQIQNEKMTKTFEFDRVFNGQADQQLVFEEAKLLVTSVMDGFNVCIMAYGQTGSGKTYTMQGPQENPGVNIRALKELFDVQEEREKSHIYKIEASVFEIYNEQIFDLLQGKQDQNKLEVKEDIHKGNGVYVTNLTVKQILNMEEATQLLNQGQKQRHTFFTNMNEHSSRSHLVLTLYITFWQKEQNMQAGSPSKKSIHRAKLQLVDLAGSERLSQSGASGQRLKETQAINSSLATLGDVLHALRDRKTHIPYRNSKLTRVLSDSLGGQAKTLMFVNVSPTLENMGESKVSLEFGSKTQKIELNQAPLLQRSSRSKNYSRGDINTPKSLDDNFRGFNSRQHN